MITLNIMPRTLLIVIILITGVLFRLALTANGNFLFHMDSARDMVDVREMVILKKIRLIGPTSAIDGLFSGPAWYYLLSVPFILSGGDPYAAILMQIILWAIGGFFLLKLVSSWGKWLIVPIGFIWIASNHIVLTSFYAFNPTPVMLLSPLFIYLLFKYLENGRAIYGIFTWFLAGLFFNFEMNFGVFTPIIIGSLVWTKNINLVKQKAFWMGFVLFILALMPQIIFDLKHQFIMSKAILRHLAENSNANINFPVRFQGTIESFYNTFLPTLFNSKLLTGIILVLFIPIIYRFFKNGTKEIAVLISIIFIFVPFLGYLILPVSINPWHLGGEMAVLLVLIAFLLKKLMDGGKLDKTVSLIISIMIIFFGLSNIVNFFINDFKKTNEDPSLYRNEIAAIDYVYQKAGDRNFKVYDYLPSIIDYPYQYLILF